MIVAKMCCPSLLLPLISTFLRTRHYLQRVSCCRWAPHRVWQRWLFAANYPCIYHSPDLHTTRSNRPPLNRTQSHPSQVISWHRTGFRINSPAAFKTALIRVWLG